MQKWNLGFFRLRFKIQIKMQHKDLLTFFFFIKYNGFFIQQLYTALYHQQLDTVQVNTAFTICIPKVYIYTNIYVCMEGIFVYIIYIIDYIYYIYYIYRIYDVCKLKIFIYKV